MKHPIRNGLLLAAIVFIADQFSKWLMLDVVNIVERPAIEVAPFLKLVMVWIVASVSA